MQSIRQYVYIVVISTYYMQSNSNFSCWTTSTTHNSGNHTSTKQPVP